jgi:hypothetical protein
MTCATMALAALSATAASQWTPMVLGSMPVSSRTVFSVGTAVLEISSMASAIRRTLRWTWTRLQLGGMDLVLLELGLRQVGGSGIADGGDRLPDLSLGGAEIEATTAGAPATSVGLGHLLGGDADAVLGGGEGRGAQLPQLVGHETVFQQGLGDFNAKTAAIEVGVDAELAHLLPQAAQLDAALPSQRVDGAGLGLGDARRDHLCHALLAHGDGKVLLQVDIQDPAQLREVRQVLGLDFDAHDAGARRLLAVADVS